MNTEHRQQKISFWHSMKTQFIAVVILVAAVIVILYTLMIMPGVKSNIRSIYSDYLLDLSISYGREMESAMQVNIDLLDNPEAAQDILQQIDVAGAKTAYAYLVGFDGTMLYHPTAEKIGQPVENEAVKKMLKEIQGGSIPKPETVQYVFQGEKKFSACYTSKKQFILVVTADDAELLAPALMLEQRGILISGVLLLLGALAAFVFATRITRPLSKITDSVNRIAQLDLRNDQVLEQCAAHRGEVGSIANAVLRMKEALTEIVQKIRQQSGQLFDASETLNSNAVKTAGNVNNVETAVNEIATSATSQAQETQGATESIISMGTMIEDSTSQVKSMNETADVMNESGQIAKKALEELGEINERATESINVIYEQTNTTNDSALKIKDATSLIASIADETNLLSLNASIEAARAEGIRAEGPVPPDTVFSKARGGWYDIVVAMYHDQGHIPLKVVGFVYDRDKQAWDAVAGVNITLGLPIIRVSVDHGTAFDQAGTGTASELSLKNSLEYAVMFARNRKQQRV